ncbi:hypothetical protein Tco_0795264 [Tanacetum coccineum]
MAESSNLTQIPSSPNFTLKEEPITLDRPESPNPFLPTNQVEFNFNEMLFITNNEVARCCLRKAFTSALTQYVEYLVEFWYTAIALENSRIWVSTPTRGDRGEIGVTTFRNATGAYYSNEYVDSPSLAIVKPWFAEIGYNGDIGVKGTLKKRCLPLRRRLLMGQIIQCLGGKTGGLDQISNKDATILYCLANGVNIDFAKILLEDLIHKLNKKSRERVIPYPRFISLLLEYMAPEYANESLTINPTQVFSVNNWAHPPHSVVGEMHKEVQQAAGGPTSLGATDEKNDTPPQLSSDKSALTLIKTCLNSASIIFHSESASRSDVLANFTAEADPGIFASNEFIP